MSDVSAADRQSFVYFTNRGSDNFKAALEPIGGRAYQQGDRHIDLLYFDQYGGKTPPEDVSVGFTLIDRQRTIPLDHKAKMANALIDAGINYPRVYFDEVDVPDEPDSLWFIKDPLATAGQGICVTSREHIANHFSFGYIIQEAVQDLALIEGKKFTLRAYVLVNQGQLYLFPAGIIVLHGAAYDPGSKDPMVQFEHADYMDQDSPIKMFPFEDYAPYETVFNDLKSHVIEVFSAFTNLLKYEKANTYCVFGVDVLVKSDLSTVMIEINDRPNIVHTRLVNERVNIPMVQAWYAVLDPSKARRQQTDAVRFELIANL